MGSPCHYAPAIMGLGTPLPPSRSNAATQGKAFKIPLHSHRLKASTREGTRVFLLRSTGGVPHQSCQLEFAGFTGVDP